MTWQHIQGSLPPWPRVGTRQQHWPLLPSLVKGQLSPGTLAVPTIHEHNNYSTNDENKTAVIMMLLTRKGT